MKRRNLEDTWKYLEKQAWEMPRDKKGKAFVPKKMPSYDDKEALGFSFFRAWEEGANLSDLTLPRTFFGRSKLTKVDFSNTDLTESRICWNDFTDCNFTNADLSDCDLRSSDFIRCKFQGTNLQRVDLRHSTFKKCDFTDASFADAIAQKIYSLDSFFWLLSKEQKASVKWCKSPGSLPDGG